jgi:phosphohistidine phosphatase
MKRLLLMRHAKAVPADEGVADFGRQLAERGERDARRMGQRLRRRAAQPDRIIASPAERALRTAQLVAAEWGYAVERIASDQRLYLAEPHEILTVIGAQHSDVTTLLIVGHNPGLTELAHGLLPGLDVDDLPTGGIVALDSSTERWAAIGDAQPTLVYYDYPKNSAPPTAR